jgi:histidine phosphotransferase ChpT
MARQGIDRSPSTTVFDSTEDHPSLLPGHRRIAARGAVDMRVLELLAARLCHELSGPLGAISNGVELLAEEQSEPGTSLGTSFLDDAFGLVSHSARRAASRLQFYRFAYGYSEGSASAGSAPYSLAMGFFDATSIACDYPESIRGLPRDWQRLVCNLLSFGAELLPRGGRLAVTEGPLNLEAAGPAATLSPEAREALTLATPAAALTSRTIQAYFTGLLAKRLDCRVIGATEPGRVRLTAVPPAL